MPPAIICLGLSFPCHAQDPWSLIIASQEVLFPSLSHPYLPCCTCFNGACGSLGNRSLRLSAPSSNLPGVKLSLPCSRPLATHYFLPEGTSSLFESPLLANPTPAKHSFVVTLLSVAASMTTMPHSVTTPRHSSEPNVQTKELRGLCLDRYS